MSLISNIHSDTGAGCVWLCFLIYSLGHWIKHVTSFSLLYHFSPLIFQTVGFSLFVHDCSCLNPRLCWHWILGNCLQYKLIWGLNRSILPLSICANPLQGRGWLTNYYKIFKNTFYYHCKCGLLYSHCHMWCHLCVRVNLCVDLLFFAVILFSQQTAFL